MLKRLLFKEAVDVSGPEIFANAEVMTPAEFVKKYGQEEMPGMTPPASTSELGGPEEAPAGAPPEAAPPGGEAPPPGGEVTPESFQMEKDLNILLESDGWLEEDSFIDLSKGRESLKEIDKKLNKLLRT